MKLTLKHHHLRFKAIVTTQLTGLLCVLSMVHDSPMFFDFVVIISDSNMNIEVTIITLNQYKMVLDGQEFLTLKADSHIACRTHAAPMPCS